MKRLILIILFVCALGQFMAYGETKNDWHGNCPGPGCPANNKKGWWSNCPGPACPSKSSNIKINRDSTVGCPNNSSSIEINRDAPGRNNYEKMNDGQLQEEKELLEKYINDVQLEQEKRKTNNHKNKVF